MKKGFTLLELLIIIAIIGILVVIVLVAVEGVKKSKGGYITTETGEVIKFEKYFWRGDCVEIDNGDIICGSFKIKFLK